MKRPMVRFKPEVVVKPAPAGVVILAALPVAASAVGVDVLVTCGAEGHGPTDPHTLGEAFDLSSAYTPSQILALKAALELALSNLTDAPIDVLYECPRMPMDARLQSIVYLNPKATAPHFHIQRRKGTVYA